MKTQDCQSLLRWYSKNQRRLPWRETLDPYSVLVSEFMLQQTTVAAVIPKYFAWMQEFSGFEALAMAEENSVLNRWSGLGYYQRARRLHKAAQEVVRLGQVPNTYEGLIKLPGVGPYTAAAVASICFGRPKLAVDTNVARVLFRYHALKKHPQDKSAIEEIHRETSSCLQANDPGELNQALMELGATTCKVAIPECLGCPIASGCQGRLSSKGPTEFPIAPSPKKTLQTPGRAIVLVRKSDQSVLLVKGTSLGLLSPLFQPPILFSKMDSQEAFHSALSKLERLLEDEEIIREWQLKYSISGRRLLLRCSRWDLDDIRFSDLKSSLKNAGLSVSSLSNEQDNSVPVSSLTRKILLKCWGNR